MGSGGRVVGGAQEMPPPIAHPGTDLRDRLVPTAWGDEARAQREARAREAQFQAAQAAESRRAAEELDRWAADQALLGRAHLQDPAHDPMDIRYADHWPGLERVAAPRPTEFPSAGGAGPATREEFRPTGGREPPARRVQMGEGTGEFRPGSRCEPPFPAAPIQQPREEAVAPAVRDAFRPPGGREPPLRHTTHRLPDYVPLDVTRDAAHGGARE